MPERQGLIPLRGRVKELERIYGTAGKDIAAELLRFDIGDFQELKVMRTEEKVDRLIKRLNRSAVRWTNDSIPEAYRKGAEVSRIRLEVLGAKKDIEFPPITHKNTIDNDIDKTIDVLLKANMSIKQNVAIYLYLARQAFRGLMQIQEFSYADEEVFMELLREEAARGGSLGDLERLIRIHLKRELYERKFILINGRNYDMIKYAKMVARTTLREAQSEAVKNMAKQFDMDLVEISKHGTTCRSNICQQFEGEIYSISGKTPGYELIPEWPPFHPNCMHFATLTSLAALETRGVID